MTEPDPWRQAFLDEMRAAFAQQRRLAERALEQVGDADLFRSSTADDNSIAVLLKHVGGNLASRWDRPLDSDGEKPERDRDREFVVDGDTAATVRAVWDRGWTVAEAALAGFRPEDLDRTVRIRGEQQSLLRALHRSLAHTAQHVGQLVLLAKQWRGAGWQTLTIPRGRSAEYLARPPE